MKHFILLLCTLFLFKDSFGQEEIRQVKLPYPYAPTLKQPTTNRVDKESDSPTTPFVNYLPGSGGTPTQSPENSNRSFLKDIPVNLYTGTPIIQVPIYTLTSGSLSLPIYLNYNSSGIRASEVASWVGLGWSLEGIPTLTRQVRGLPDEGKRVTDGNSVAVYKGYYNYGAYINTQGYSLDNDNESDWYYFNTGNATYKFMFDASQTAHFFPENDIKVEVSSSLFQPGLDNIVIRFDQFRFILPDGTKYIFTAPTGPSSTNITETTCEADIAVANVTDFSLTNYFFSNKVVSAWAVEKIADKNGNEISFNHALQKYSFYKLAEQETRQPCSTPDLKINRVFVQTARISEIITPHITIDLFGGDNTREDVDNFSSASPQSINTDAPKLSIIQVVDNSNLTNPLIWTFNHGYFTGTDNSGFDLPGSYLYSDVGHTHQKRLKLSEIVMPDNSKYSFKYYGEGATFNYKTRFSYGVDHWGYLNGYDSNILSYGLIGKDEISQGCGSNRSADYTYMSYGSLESITHSSGLKTEFKFEANRAKNYDSGNSEIGGLRIKEIKIRDLVRNYVVKKSYDYTSESLSSGFLIMEPIYRYNRTVINLATSSSLYANLINESGRAHVGYGTVTETVLDSLNVGLSGKTIFSFDNPEELLSIKQQASLCSTPTNKCYFPERFHPDYNFNSGVMIESKTYNNSNNLISNTLNTFTPSNGLLTLSVNAKKVININNDQFSHSYTQYFKKFRLETQSQSNYSRDGSGTPVVSHVDYTYKDEMPESFRNVYKGVHNNVVKTTTIDEDGHQLESINKIVGDFNFYLDSTLICEVDCGDYTNPCDTLYCYYLSNLHVPLSGTEGRAIYELLGKNGVYFPVESLQKIDNQTVGASYQSYFSNNSQFSTLPSKQYVLRNIPKSAFHEVYFNTSDDGMVKDPDYGGSVSEILSYNTKGMPLTAKNTYGPTSSQTYASSGILPLSTTRNVGKPDALTTTVEYDKVFQGVSKQISPNLLEIRNEYYDSDARLKYIRDKDNNILKRFEYDLNPSGAGVSLITWNNSLRRKQCSGGQITLTVYVDGLASGATAQFSTNGGSSWQSANVGSNGFAFTMTPSNNYQSFMARPSDDPSQVVSTQYHSSCSTDPPLWWGAYSQVNNGDGTCTFNVSAQNLAIDSYAEFSVDNSNWYRASNGDSGMTFLLPRTTNGVQDFYLRPAEDTTISIYGYLTCPAN